MDRFSVRQRIEIALIWAIGLLLLYLFVVSPVITAEHAAARAEREAAEAELARVDAYQRLLLTDERAEPKLRARQARLADALPEERGQGRFIHVVELLARRNNVTVVGFAPQPPETVGEIIIQPIELKFRGTYFDVLSFLHAVQEGERSVRFGSFSITVEGNEMHGVLLLHIAAHAAAEP